MIVRVELLLSTVSFKSTFGGSPDPLPLPLDPALSEANTSRTYILVSPSKSN